MSFDVDSRMRAIATNAIREARIAKQIDQGPWLDDHAQRLEVIFNLLMAVASSFEAEVEHYPLVVQNQPEKDAKLSQVSAILDSIAAEIMPNENAGSSVSFSLPKGKDAGKVSAPSK